MNLVVRIGMTALMLMPGLTLPAAWADEWDSDKNKKGFRAVHERAARHGSTCHYLRYLLMHQKEIGLTEEQIGTLKTMQLDLDRTRIKIEDGTLRAEGELAALVKDEKPDLSSIEAKVKQIAALVVELRISELKVKLEATALLTPEQREKGEAEHETPTPQQRVVYTGQETLL